MNLVRNLWRWIALTLVLISVWHYVPSEESNPDLLHVVTFVGIVLLAVPAIRINEQARQIERVRTLQLRITETRKGLDTLRPADEQQRRPA